MSDTEMQRIKAICDVAGVEDIGELSDGFHTFNGLYEQRMILFAALVKAYKGKAWKSYRHEDGEWCFGGGWFIVGIDTPEGSYTYHYENKYWDMFDCIDLPRAPHWDGHTEADAETRLMSLEPEQHHDEWCTDCKEYDKTKHCCPRFNRVIRTAMADASRWIPVEARLPEEAYPVIVTWKNNDPAPYYQYILGKLYVGVAHYKNGKWFWYSSTTEDVLMEYGRCDFEEFDEAIQVIAWMPLPEPYYVNADREEERHD